MATHVYIAGIDRGDKVLFEGISIEQVLTQAVDTCSFRIRDVKPGEGEEVKIVDDVLGVLFAGIIDNVCLVRDEKTVKIWEVQAQDYTYLLDRKLVAETYENMPADDIVRDIIAKYGGGVFTTNHVQTGAPVVECIVFDYKRPSDCLKELAEYVGWDWFVDFGKDIWFFNPAQNMQPAPMSLEPGGYFRNLKHAIDQQGLRNRVYVRGGTMLSDPWTYEVKADGSARAWVLPHKPHDLTVKVGGVAKTVGIENVDDEATKDFLVNYQEKYVRCSAQTPTPAAGTTLSFTYRYDIDVITMVEDIASQQAIAAVQGGDGVYEHVIVDDSLTTIDAAEAAGLADLREHANPRVKGSFETEVSGWQPGQLVMINLPDRGIMGTFLVQKVSITPCTPEKWTYKVEYGGRLLGIADWLQALWKAQQKKKLNETALLHKFHYGAEMAKITDEAQGTLRMPPWTVEQGLEATVGKFCYSETTESDWNSGSLTGVEATSAGDIELALTMPCYRCLITLNPATPYSDYHVKVVLTPTDFDYSKVKNDGGDIRFTDIAGNSLAYWVESWDSGGTSVIWVKVPTQGTTQFYMLYGDPDATSQSNGAATFPFFDDFSGTSLDTSKWYVPNGTSYTMSDSVLRINVGAVGLQSALPFVLSDGYAVEAKIRFEVLAANYSGTIPELSSSRFTQSGNAGADATVLFMRNNGVSDINHWVGDGSTTSYNIHSGALGWTSSEGVWYRTALSVAGGELKFWRDGAVIHSHTGITWYKQLRYLSLGAFHGDGTYDIQDTSYDFVFVRRYAPTEPTVMIGPEQVFGSRLSPVLDLSPVGVAAGSTISWNATLPANTSLTIETNLSLDGGVTWQGWQVCTNGGPIPGITEGTDLSDARLQIRQTLSTTDTTVTPQLHDVAVVVQSVQSLAQLVTVGSLLVAWQPGSRAWAQLQYRTSTDGVTWSTWQVVDPTQIEVPYPGYVEFNIPVRVRNWKKPFVESDIVCGFVVCAA